MMWGDCDSAKVNEYGKGKVVSGISPREWLENNSIGPDFTGMDPGVAKDLDFIHRQTDACDIYFVRNKTLNEISSDCSFRTKKKHAQLWDPSDGSIAGQNLKYHDGINTCLSLTLPPGGSVFIVFSDCFTGAGSKVAESKRIQENTLNDHVMLDNNWKLEFDPEWGAPAEINLAKLISWTEHDKEGVKYYSGQGVYTRTIEIPAGWMGTGSNIKLDLGDVRELAEVFINDESAGIVWKPPFSLDITSLIQPGSNELRIEVMNLWINRLTGDKNLPDDKKLTSTNIRSDGGSWLSNYKEWEIIPSGLLGPVKLLHSVKRSKNQADQ
jgi:hypothetical protein